MHSSQRLMGLGSLLCLTLTTSCAHSPKAPPELTPAYPPQQAEPAKIPLECDPSSDPVERAKPAPTAMPYTTALEKVAKWQHAATLLAGYGADLEGDNKKLRTDRASCYDGLVAQGLTAPVQLEVEPK